MKNLDPRWPLPLASVFFTAISSFAATVRVPADAPTIQAGIDAAAGGDTVLVAPATYTGAGNKNLDSNGKVFLAEDLRTLDAPVALILT